MQLDSRQRKFLKGLAHHLKAVVHIGKDGLSPSLLQQIEQALLSHELIKVKLGESAPMDREAAAKELPEKTGAEFVQNIGRVFILYREHPEEPKIDLPFPRQMGEGEGDGGGAAEGAPPPDLGFATVRQRGPVGDAPAPRSPVRETRSDRDGAGDRPRKNTGGRAKAKPRSKKSKPPRRVNRGGPKRGGGRR